jgi:histone acetyltransferase
MEAEKHVDIDKEFGIALQEVIAQRPWRELTQIEIDERDRTITYQFITNDGTDASLTQLVHCKCLFARQLPKMPKEYIVRLVFDRRHVCLVMKKKEVIVATPPASTPDATESTGSMRSDSMHVSSDEAAPTTGKVREVVVAAVCFRPFHTFAEIAFLAVSSKDQVRGYGTRLMNHLKEAVKVRGVTDLVTYADNAAVGYFSKQGFYSPTSAQATKKDSKWHTCIKTGYDSYIKDYDGANKMVCCIYKNVNYLTLSTMREEVQAAFWRAYLKVTDHKVYEGLKTMPEKIYDIPGLEFLAPPSKQESTASPPKGIARKPKDESGSPSPPRQRPISSRLQVPTSIEAMVHDLLESALSNGSSWPFREPVDVSLAPDYYEVIKTPMDIATMKVKNAAGDYRSLGELRNDFRLMFDNCLFYNGEDSIYAQAADVLEKAVMVRMDRLEQMAKAAR